MQNDQILAYSVLGILICNILTLVALGIGAYVITRKMSELLTEVNGVVHNARAVVSNAEVTMRRVSSGAESARRIVGQVEGAVTKLTPPIALISTSAKTAQASNLKMKLLGLAVGIAVRYFVNRRNAPQRS